MAVSGGWSRVAGGFLNSSPAGLPASKSAKQAVEALLPVTQALGLAQPQQGTEMAKGPETNRDGEMVTVREVTN